MKKHLAAIVGTGRIAGYLEDDILRDHPCTHAGTYTRIPQVDLIACSGKTLEKAACFASRFGIPHYYSDLDEMLKDHEVDILSICTPAEQHVPLTIQAAESGKVKAVYCEKALGLSLEEAEEAVSCCRKNHVKLTVNYLRRWSYDYVMTRELLRSGAIGKVQTVHALFSGNIMHTGTHMFDLLQNFFGMPLWVEAKTEAFSEKERESSGYKYVKDDHFDDPDGRAWFHFPSGIDVFINGSGKDYFIFEMDIVGSHGRIRIGNFLQEFWKTNPSSHYKDFRELNPCSFPVHPESKNAWFTAVEDILSAKGEEGIGATGEDACRAMEMGFAMILSSCRSGRRVFFPLQERNMKVLSK